LLVPMIEELMRTRSTRSWEEMLTAAAIPHAPLWSYAELFGHPQMAARGMRLTVTDPHGRPVDLVGSPFHFLGVDATPPQMPPALGAHTDDVLRELLGLDPDRLRTLRERGVI